jgi:hypothetical protein
MTAEDIKYKTIKTINGLSYLSKKQIEDIKHIICCDLKIDKTEENFNTINDGIKLYFTTINNINIF